MISVYQGDQPDLPARVEYPAGWDVEVSRGHVEPYAQVQFYAPSSLEPRVRVYVVVRALPLPAAGGRYADAGALLESYRATLPSAFRIAGEHTRSVLGVPARQVDVVGTLRLPWMSPQAQSVHVVGQRAFFEHAGRLYECAWLATPRVAADVGAAFAHLLDTLTLSGSNLE